MVTELEEVPMGIIGGLDIHRKQLTFDYVDDGHGSGVTGADRSGGPAASGGLADPVRRR